MALKILTFAEALAEAATYTQAGPGALRGLKKAFENLGDYSPADAIRWMTEHQDLEFRKLDLPFNGLFGRPHCPIEQQVIVKGEVQCFPRTSDAILPAKVEFASRRSDSSGPDGRQCRAESTL